MFVLDKSEVDVEMLDGGSMGRGKTEESGSRVEKGVPVSEGGHTSISRYRHLERRRWGVAFSWVVEGAVVKRWEAPAQRVQDIVAQRWIE